MMSFSSILTQIKRVTDGRTDGQNHAMPCGRKQTARSEHNLLDFRVLNNVHNPSVANIQIKFKCRETVNETTQ